MPPAAWMRRSACSRSRALRAAARSRRPRRPCRRRDGGARPERRARRALTPSPPITRWASVASVRSPERPTASGTSATTGSGRTGSPTGRGRQDRRAGSRRCRGRAAVRRRDDVPWLTRELVRRLPASAGGARPRAPPKGSGCEPTSSPPRISRWRRRSVTGATSRPSRRQCAARASDGCGITWARCPRPRRRADDGRWTSWTTGRSSALTRSSRTVGAPTVGPSPSRCCASRRRRAGTSSSWTPAGCAGPAGLRGRRLRRRSPGLARSPARRCHAARGPPSSREPGPRPDRQHRRPRGRCRARIDGPARRLRSPRHRGLAGRRRSSAPTIRGSCPVTRRPAAGSGRAPGAARSRRGGASTAGSVSRTSRTGPRVICSS